MLRDRVREIRLSDAGWTASRCATAREPAAWSRPSYGAELCRSGCRARRLPCPDRALRNRPSRRALSVLSRSPFKACDGPVPVHIGLMLYKFLRKFLAAIGIDG